MHWVDSKANEIISKKGKNNVVASGISPSGPIHLGNFREIFTADLLDRALKNKNSKSKLLWILDDYDPLRKVYPFLDSSFKEHVGKPLVDVPDPSECHDSYSQHYSSKFLRSIKELGIEPEIRKASEMYRSGVFLDYIVKSLNNYKEIKKILEDITGRNLPKDWLPFNPLCSSCGRISYTNAIDYEGQKVKYKCECGNKGYADASQGEGKLPWRVDWPARWSIFNVTIEPFGKDHAADGGSYDTGSRISKNIFDYEPPYSVVYEQVGIKGKGEMSSSEGIVLTPGKMLEFLPPEVIRYILARKKPKRHVEVDTGPGIIQTVSDYQKAERIYYREEDTDITDEKDLGRIYELSQVDEDRIREEMPFQLPFRHLINAVQISESTEGVMKILKRTGHWDKGLDKEYLDTWISRVNNWLDDFAPNHLKFEVQEELPSKIKELEKDQKIFLRKLADLIENEDLNDEKLHNRIYELFRNIGIGAREAFQAIYLSLLGRKSGPRAAWFILSLDEEFVLNRFREVATSNFD